MCYEKKINLVQCSQMIQKAIVHFVELLRLQLSVPQCKHKILVL